MISRRIDFGLVLALSLGSFGLSFSGSALAQPAAPSDAPPAGAASATGAVSAGASATGTAAVGIDGSAKAASAVTSAGASTDESAKKGSTSASATDTSSERDSLVSVIGLERLPGSAYPAIQNRGLKYGSLWLTMHGQQFPYMPLTSTGPGLRIGVSGQVWNDLSYTHIGVDPSLAGAGINDQNRWNTQTRGVLRVTPTYNAHDGWFAQGNAEFVLHGDMQVDPATKVLASTDDLWVRIGKWNLFDVTLGRFQGWEIANHYGMALDLNTLERQGAWIMTSGFKPTDGYGLSYFWDRQDYLLGGYAVHVYPTKYLRAELLGHFGTGINTSSPYQIDVRPSVIFDVGWAKLKAGWEYGESTPQDVKAKVRDSRNGYGLAAQFVFAPYVEFGGSFGRGFQDDLDKDSQADLTASNTVQTAGGFVNVSPGHEPLVFGFGAFLNHREDFRIDNKSGPHQGKVDTNDQWLMFGAVQYTLWEQVYLKFVLSHASNQIQDFSGVNSINAINNAVSGRFRVMFLF